MPALSLEERLKLVIEYQKCKNFQKVAQRFNVNIKTARLWVRRHQQLNSVQSKPRAGGQRVVSQQAADLAVTLLVSGKHSGAKEVAEALYQQGKTSRVVHRTTVIRNAKAAAKAAGQPITAVSRLPAKELTQDTKDKRLAFCKANRRRNWSTVIFTDRKKFHFKYPGAKVTKVQWLRKGQRRVAHMVNHPSVVNLYAGITRFGITRAHIVTGTSKHASTFTTAAGKPARNITTHEYKEVLTSTLLPEGRRIFTTSKGLSTWVLQQDNDPTHKKAAQERVPPFGGVSLLANWPPNSPDLSPIENVWAWADQKVNALGCKTFEEYKDAVLQTLANIPKSMLARLFDSMEGRVQECIKREGDKLGY